MMTSPTKTPATRTLAQKRALLEARLRQAASQPRQSPLSFAQQRLWFLDQLEPDSPLYNIGSVAHIQGQIDSDALQKALDSVVARHETLRTRFACPDEDPVQIIDPHRGFELRVVDLTGEPESGRESRARSLIQSELNRPFDLKNEHLLRVTLVQLQPGQYRLVLILHHIVGDEWSLRVLFQELTSFYSGYVTGQPASLPELPIQYSDYAQWQRQWFQGDVLERQLDYWKNELKAYPPVTELQTDRPRGQSQTFSGKTLTRALGKDLTGKLEELGRRLEATPFMVSLAAFNILIHRYTQQEDLIVCSPVAGRNRVETEGLIGFFVNTLALRTNFAGDPCFEAYLAQVREVTLGAMAHQDLPFERLVEELQPERTLNHLPFTKLMFTFQNGSPEKIELPGATLIFEEIEPELAKFEITLGLRQTREGLRASVEFNRDLFEEQTINRMLGHFETLLHSIVTEPRKPISELGMLTTAEARQLLVEWNKTATDYPRERCIHELFEAQVERTPEAVAASWGNKKMTYGELNSRANQLARFLKQFDLKPDMPVGLCVDRSLEMVVGILGILKVGGAYVPLDANYPKERLAFMVEDAGVSVILTQQRLLERLPRNGAKVICLDADWEFVAREPRENMACLANARSLAYIMYTSGSTGQPKGVAVPHRGVTRLVLNTNFIQLDRSDRIAQVSNISFDAATFELWGALLTGAQLVGITRDVALSPKDFAGELREKGITAMFVTAALFNQLANEAPGAFETLRTVIAGGEALDPKWVRSVLRNRPPQRLVNGYGPTENTTFTCCYAIEQVPEEASNVPIGRPISNTTVYILDRHLNPVPVGVPGELYTGGDGLARGYWRRPELTERKFVANPFDPNPGSRLYRTGDLARFLPDGTVEFLGRIDDQVKIRGFRIELGEIETVLGRHAAVRECVVTVAGTESEEKRLVAYVAPTPQHSINASELRAYLRKQLPDYMIPSAFVKLNALPLTPNGKVDRKALPAPDQARPKLDRQYVAPRDATESQLVGIWEAVLGVHPVGIQDKFFDLGGHSMLAVKVISQIEKNFGKKLRLATLFQAPTVERLAAVLREEVNESMVAAKTSLVEIQGSGSRTPLFLVHGAGGGMFWGYINLARCLGSDQPLYGFRSRGLDGQEEFETVEELAAHYVADLRKLQPQGPYCLGGYCFGGNVAYEMACQLTEQGQKVALLALLNCAPPNSSYTRIPWTPLWMLRFSRNLIYWARYFGNWSTTQRREFFRWKWHLLKKKFSRVRNHGPLARVEPGDLVDLSSYTEDQKAVWETHIRALMNFRPRRYSGRLHLFRSPGHPLWCSFDDQYGWGELAAGGVQTITVAGAHEKILEEPFVKELAAQMSRALASVQENRARTPEQGKSPGSAGTGREAATQARAQNPSNHHPSPQGVLTQEEEKRQLDYWKTQLADLPELLDLPADHPRPAQAGGAEGKYSFKFPETTRQAVFGLANPVQAEPLAVFVAALAAVLHRYTGSPQVLIGSWAVPAPGAAENPIALRCELSDDPSFIELVRRSQQTLQAAHNYCALPFSKVVSALRPNASPSYAPIFQVALSLRTNARREKTAGSSPLDLKIDLIQEQLGFSGNAEFSSILFEPARISRLVEHLRTLIERAAAAPDLKVSQLDMLPEAEARKVLQEWNATDAEYPATKTLADLFRAQALSTPDAEALVYGEVRLTYTELYSRCAGLARHLRALGVTNESLVGVCLDRTVEMVVAIVGTLLAGGAYVPLDPKYPKDRLAFSLEDAQCKVLLTQSRLVSMLPATSAIVVCLDEAKISVSANQTETIAPISKPSDLAYVIYTSGSTGKPKGVALEHRNAVALISWAKTTFSPEELSGVLASTSICFDLSVYELFVPLCSGGKVILADNALCLSTLPAAAEVRLINTVPSAIRELLRLRAIPSTVQVVNLAGEPLSSELVDQIYNETHVRKVFDLYGPTETTTYSTGGLRKPSQPATIGRPLSNEQVYLLDRALKPVPIGVPGELFIGGAGVTRGYLNRPEMTQQRFIADPFRSGGRLYRTGDLARWRTDGTLEYLGRIDHQVKIRGFRIELGEIETVLKSVAGVSAAIVVAREDIPGDKRLAAYIVAQADRSLSAEELRRALRSQLPDFMVPSDFVFLSALPMTPNGKIDRKALPPPADRSETLRTDLVAPRNDVETQLAALWRDVLGVRHISIHDNFFDLGGHSLLATRIISAIRDTFDVELPLQTLFAAPTIAALAEIVSGIPARDNSAPVCRITAVPREGALTVSYVQERLWFLDQFAPGSAAYNVPTALRLNGALDLEVLQKAINTLVSRHEPFRTTFKYADNNLTQVIAPELFIPIPYIDLEHEPVEGRELRARTLINEQARLPFDLEKGPLVRLTLIRIAKAEHILLVVMHHSISDGWSMALFFQQLGSLYDAIHSSNSTGAHDKPALQYADYAHWQRQWMTGPLLDGELSYWKRALAGAPGEIPLPLDHPRPQRPSGRAETCSAQLDATATRRIAEFVKREGCTPFMFFLAALMLVLRRWTGQQDLVVGTVVAGRTRRELEAMMGCFMNFLPLRATLQDGDTVRALLTRVRNTVLEAQSHQDCPFEKIVEAINPRRSRDQNPLYNVALLLQNFPPNLLGSRNLQATPVPVSLEAALLDLRLEIEQAGEGLSLGCEYKSDLFEARTIQQFLNAWLRAIDQFVSSPESVLSALAAYPAIESKRHAPALASDKGTIVVASTFTAEPVEEALRYWFQKVEMDATIEFAPYNQVFQQLLDPASQLSRNQKGANVLLIRLEDWHHADSSNQDSAGAVRPRLGQTADEFLQAIKASASRSAVPILVCLCPCCPSRPGKQDLAAAFQQIRQRLEAALAQIGGVHLLTPAELSNWYPVAEYYDAAADELGRVPYTPLFFTALATGLARKLHALRRPPYKVIALDCDNTLWSGVCGEEGPRGIQLDEARRSLQQFMLDQRQNGMLLCLCSKNNPEDVHAVFAERSDFPLKLEHFAATRLNWEPKSSNLQSLANELGLGIDSFIFVDDNPVECAEVQANSPGVLALQLPESIAEIPLFLNHCWAFDHLKVTQEDRQRGELYRQNRLREQLRAETPTLQQFLSRLELKISILPIEPADYARVAQLTQRTNQFNFTTRRRSEAELTQWIQSGQAAVVRVTDRFGDYGLVGTLLYQLAGNTLSVDTFLLSCRVLGRGVEHRMLNFLAETAQSLRAEWIDLHFVPSPKNKPALDFLEQVGRSFKQPLNGGFVFRLPVQAASQVVFQAAEPPSNGAGEAKNGESSPGAPAALSGTRFSGFRDLALESADVARVHSSLSANVSLRSRVNDKYVPPRNELERKLCAQWEELLRIQPIGIHDDFFELGGHSLMAVRLFAEIDKLIGRKLPLVTLFQAPTIAQLAELCSQDEGAGSLLVPIQPRGDRTPLFLVHGAGGDVLWGYANLAAHMPPDQPIYGIKSHGQDGREELMQLEQMARAYIEVVRTRQPHGPYVLGGYCFGGNVAYEMARQLRMLGEQVALVLLIDTAPANAGYETVPWYRPGFAWRFARNLNYWLSDFAALKAEERRRFMGRKLRWVGRKLKRGLGLARGPARFDLEEVIDPAHFPENELKLWQVHLEALIAHVERPYAGRVALLRTRGQALFCSLAEDFCWGKLIKGGISVCCIPGSHENIFMEPHVRVLASELTHLLETTRRCVENTSPAANSAPAEPALHL